MFNFKHLKQKDRRTTNGHKNDENISQLQITEAMLVYCNLLNIFQQDSRV